MAMNARREQSVTLKKAIPVHIGYSTAWVDSDGAVRFYEDPYGLDKTETRGLLSAISLPRSTSG